MKEEDCSKIRDSIITKEIKQYLKAEAALNKFFSRVNYCLPNCINMTGSFVYGVGCCRADYWQSKEYETKYIPLLIKERKRLYGEPCETNAKCAYHDIKIGCRSITCKPPLCAGHICELYRCYLFENYRIDYPRLVMPQYLCDILDSRGNGRWIVESAREWISIIDKIDKE